MATQYSPKNKKLRAVPAHSWTVITRRSNGETIENGAPDNLIHTQFNVDEVSGLNMGSVNIIETRAGGNSSPYKSILPGLPTTAPVTFRGIYMFDMSDLNKLIRWHKESVGELPVNLADRYRDIDLQPKIMGSNDKDLTPSLEGVSPGTITLKNCLCTNLTFSDLSQAVGDPHRWELEVRFAKLIRTGGKV